MLHNEGSSDLKYDPQVNDYVVWTTALGMIHEGWVYFKSTPLAPKRGWEAPIDYITIELGVKEKPNCTENDPQKGSTFITTIQTTRVRNIDTKMYNERT